jgi:phosphoglycolate phosphatase-like HAD superfamily hydrolase
MTALILWDVDRTLLTIEGVSQDIYATAFRQVTGSGMERMPPMGGRTDHDLITSVLTAHGLEVTDQRHNDFRRALATTAHGYREEMRAKGRALPGAAEALDALASEAGVVQSVVTGNIRPIAELKLSLFGLDRHIHFDVGGYGSDDSDRATLVRLACERAERKYGTAFADGRAVVVGDTTYDVAGALGNGLAAVGVASGDVSTEELEAAGATVVLPSLADTEAVVRAVLWLLRTTGAERRC